MMDDDFKKIRAAMDAATPNVDPAKRAADIAAAMENFDAGQETVAQPRLTPERPIGVRMIEGVRKMFASWTVRGGLVGTTAIVAVGLLYVMPEGQFTFGPADPAEITLTELEGKTSARPEAPLVVAEEARAESTDERVLNARDREQANTGAPLQVDTLADAVTAQSGLRQDQTLGFVRPQPDVMPAPEVDTEAFANAEANPLKVVTEDPVSTFSIDVDTAAYSVVRSSLNMGQLPPSEAVRIEEMINYFPYDYAGPNGEHPFEATVSVMPTPWNTGTNLVHIGIQGEEPVIEDRPPLNLVFLIDTSGSMNSPQKLPLLIQSFRLMLSELRPEDEVAIVTYAGSAGLVLEATPASERAKITTALERLAAGGSTAGQAGLQQAYATAAQMTADGEVSRVILATDGDFNVGLSDPEALKDFIADKRETGTYLSVLGFGRGNLDDATMQALAQNGNGTAAYIDTLNEARKVLVDQLTGALFPIANDVKIQVEFNPAEIAEYRLIGYETRALKREDFNNDKVDAGDIGAGHTVTAIYEVTPVGSDAILTDALRYQAAPANAAPGELGYLKLRYKEPGASDSVLIETPITAALDNASDEARFAAAIAGFGQLLRGDDTYLGDWDYGAAIELANGAKGTDPFGYRAEAVNLMRLAETLDQ